ncbi:shufflon system plasmid conjugative transfer pilus tip adhesin PilV [Rahnella rivi]|uniref:shufflon system plasmid conjugative transfer pilus tip adhesin PilV n=1 Tax=Rahnella rivi TaxID=2816249 RepID=UPI0039BDC13D
MRFHKRKPRPVHRGNMLMQAGIALAIVLYLTPGAIDRYAGWQQDKAWTVTASHLSFVAQAGKRYVRDNRDTLLTQVTGGPVILTGATLRTQGYLPAGFSLTNDSGQTYQLAVAKDPGQAGQLVAFVLTTGGSEIPYKGLRQIASDTDGMGGYVWPANTATGADGGWQAKLSDYGLSGQQGRLAAFLSADALGTDADESDRLYRYQVTGRPDLNRMHAAIDMGGNNLNNTATVNAQTGNFSGNVGAANVSASGNVTASGNVGANGNVTANGNITAANTITANSDIGSNNGWIITNNDKGWINQTHGGGFTMTDDDWIRAVNNKGIYTGGQMRAGGLRSDSDVSAGGVLRQDQVNIAGAECGILGAISHDSTGAALFCVNGAWSKSGGNLYISGLGSQSLGTHSFCALMKVNLQANSGETSDVGTCQVTREDSGIWALIDNSNKNGKGCQAVCF